MFHDADTTISSCCSRVVSLGKCIDSQEVVEGTERTCLGLGQRLDGLRTLSAVNVVDDEVRAQDIAVHVLVEVIIAHDSTVSSLVEREIDAVHRLTLITQDVSLTSPKVIAQQGE